MQSLSNNLSDHVRNQFHSATRIVEKQQIKPIPVQARSKCTLKTALVQQNCIVNFHLIVIMIHNTHNEVLYLKLHLQFIKPQLELNRAIISSLFLQRWNTHEPTWEMSNHPSIQQKYITQFNLYPNAPKNQHKLYMNENGNPIQEQLIQYRTPKKKKKKFQLRVWKRMLTSTIFLRK